MDKIDGKLILPTPKSIMDRTGPDRTRPARLETGVWVAAKVTVEFSPS